MSTSVYSPFIILVAVVACVSNPQVNAPAVKSARLMSQLLTETELSSVDTPNALEAIRRLRPQYLSTALHRGVTDDLVVYLDGVRVGGVEALSEIAASAIREIRRLDPREAALRYGAGHLAGAIVIATKPGR